MTLRGVQRPQHEVLRVIFPHYLKTKTIISLQVPDSHKYF